MFEKQRKKEIFHHHHYMALKALLRPETSLACVQERALYCKNGSNYLQPHFAFWGCNYSGVFLLSKKWRCSATTVDSKCVFVYRGLAVHGFALAGLHDFWPMGDCVIFLPFHSRASQRADPPNSKVQLRSVEHNKNRILNSNCFKNQGKNIPNDVVDLEMR